MRIRTVAVGLSLIAATAPAVRAASCGGPPPIDTPVFDEPILLDHDLAGGEPSIQPLADGSLLYSAHAGTTHLYKPAPPAPPQDATGWASTYTGSLNTWRSTDGGETWEASPLLEELTGQPLPVGFSDPSTAVDRAGNVYLSAIDTASVWLGRSNDGASFVGNKFMTFNMDREWIAADTEGVVYMVASPFGVWPDDDGAPTSPTTERVLWRSSNGGRSFEDLVGSEVPGIGSMSPVQVNPVTGSVVVPDSGGLLWLHEWPNARSGDITTRTRRTIEEFAPHDGGFFNSSAFDDAGNLTVAWNTETSVGIVYSRDGGSTYDRSVIQLTNRIVRWPWVAAGSEGRVAVSWLERTATSDAWRVKVAVTNTGTGWVDDCGKQRPPVWKIATVTQQPMHVGSICDSGLACNSGFGRSSDRRLGDYFTIAITPEGSLVFAYSDTATHPNDVVSHPAFVRQVGGIDLRG